jgi:hypothetical protein
MSEKNLSSFSIMSWKLPEELGYFNRLLAELDNENNFLPDTQIEQMLSDFSNIPHYVNVLLQQLAEDEILESAIAENIKQLQARKSRYNKRIESIKSYIEMIMGRYDLKKFECPNGTVSKVVKRDSRINVLDESVILLQHPHYFVKEIKLDKGKLKADLLEGKIVEGAELTDTEFIQVRR